MATLAWLRHATRIAICLGVAGLCTTAAAEDGGAFRPLPPDSGSSDPIPPDAGGAPPFDAGIPTDGGGPTDAAFPFDGPVDYVDASFLNDATTGESDAAAGDDGAVAVDASTTGGGGDDGGGCSCSVPGASSSTPASGTWLALGIGVAWLVRRRRRG